MKILSHASIIGVEFFLEHKIEEDSTEAKQIAMPKLTYNKMCPCTINEAKEEKEEKKFSQGSAN